MFSLNKAIENEYEIRANYYKNNILSTFLKDICNYFMIITNTVT